jgi:hypothetical protein
VRSWRCWVALRRREPAAGSICSISPSSPSCGRGAQEKTLAELKGEFALDVLPTNHYGANRPGSSSACSRTTRSGPSNSARSPSRSDLAQADIQLPVLQHADAVASATRAPVA